MKKLLFILAVAVITIVVLLFILRPELLDKIWLWLIGFAGGIIGFFRNVYDHFLQNFRGKDKDNIASAAKQVDSNKDILNAQQIATQKLDSIAKKIEEKQTISALNTPFNGTTLTVLRYTDDEETTLGLLFFRDDFFSYTLEDTFREVKVKGKTRVPAGEYSVGFNQSLTDLTQTYRKRFSWFTYHIEIKNVPNFDGIYIHLGNTTKDTAGCLLIADGINGSSSQKSLIYSTQAFERFYKRMKDLLDSGEKVRIVIHDENWFRKTNLQNT